MGWCLVVGACFEVGLGNSRVAIGAFGCCVCFLMLWTWVVVGFKCAILESVI